jgi:type IV pilus assembly protein PilW
VPGTYTLVVKHAKPTPVTPGSEAGTKTYVISNNTSGTLYDGADGTPATITAHLGGTLNAWEYQAHVYYIRQAAQCSSYDATNHTAPCLARKTLQWDSSSSTMKMVTEDVVDGVEAMQLEFGRDSDSDSNIDSFTKASSTSAWGDKEWAKVAAVRFTLLLREEREDPLYDASIRTYAIEDYPNTGDNSFTPSSGDHFHRSMIKTTILLRNPDFVIQG